VVLCRLLFFIVIFLLFGFALPLLPLLRSEVLGIFEMVLLPENVRERPVAQSMDVTQLAPLIEDLLRPTPILPELLGKWTQ
jgi:hypothetical protein